MSDRSTVLSDRAEREWIRLEHLLELSSGFWLGFIFSPSTRDALVLKNRTQEAIELAGHSFRVLAPREPAELATLFLTLEKLVDVGCVWVVALHVDPPHSVETPWRDAWDNLFLRFNERRDVIRRQLNGGLIFVGPPEMKPRIREAAPDTWSIKAIVLDLPANGEITDVSTSSPGLYVYSSNETSRAFPFDLSRLFRTQPTLKNPEFALHVASHISLDRRVGRAVPLLDAATAFLERGEFDSAKERADEALMLIQEERRLEGRADILLETRARALLAEILCKVGDFDAAREHIRVAITERRAVTVEELPLHWLAMAGEIELLAENPGAAIEMCQEGLRILEGDGRRNEADLTRGRIYLFVQLGCAYLVMKEFNAAADEFLRAISLTQTLLTQGFPDLSIVMSFILKWLGDTWDASGQSVRAESVYREAVMLDRATLANQPDSIIAMRELSIALNRLGSVQRESDDYDDLQDACEAFEEALALRRAIVAKQRDRASLRDLLSSLKKVHGIKKYVVKSKKAFRSDVDPIKEEMDTIAAEIHLLEPSP